MVQDLRSILERYQNLIQYAVVDRIKIICNDRVEILKSKNRNFQHPSTMRIVGSRHDLEEAEGMAVVVHFLSVIVSYNLSNVFATSSAITFALTGLVPVTIRPSAEVKAIPMVRR
jgi:hypothetical protein